MIESIDTTILKAAARSTKIKMLDPNIPMMNLWWGMRGQRIPEGLSDCAVALAELHWSEWIARCPYCPKWIARGPYCPNAMPISIKDPRFSCSQDRCQTGGISGADGAAIAVVLPPANVLMWVEALLLLRPKAENRNWLPTETIKDLIAENVAHHITLDKIDKAKLALRSRWEGLFGAEAVANVMKSKLMIAAGIKEEKEDEEEDEEECYEPSPECYDDEADDGDE